MRKDILDRQVTARRMYAEERVNRVRKVGGAFAPLLAVRTSHPEGLGKKRSTRAGIGGSGYESGTQSQDAEIAGLKPEAWNTIDHAARLCAAMEEAIVHNHVGVMAELVEESIEVGKSMALLEGQMGRDSKLKAAGAAFGVMTSHEKMLLEARRQIEKQDDKEHLWGGVVEKYGYSPAHDAMVMMVDMGGDKYAYPVDKIQTAPEIGSTVHVHKKKNGFEIDDMGRSAREIGGRERVA